MSKKRILVDMSATLIHYGHIRLLKKASNFGKVIVALTKDNQIKKFKGYKPEMKFKFSIISVWNLLGSVFRILSI